MVDQDLILAKTSALMNHVQRVREKSRGFSHVPKAMDALESLLFNMVQAVQSAIDLGQHLVADQNWGVAGSYRELFEILVQKDVLESSLAEAMIRLVRFRNLIVHEYMALDQDKLKKLLTSDFSQLEILSKALLNWKPVSK